MYEKAVNMATVVYQLEGEGEKTHFVPIHENIAKMLQVSILHPTKVSWLVGVTTINVYLSSGQCLPNPIQDTMMASYMYS